MIYSYSEFPKLSLFSAALLLSITTFQGLSQGSPKPSPSQVQGLPTDLFPTAQAWPINSHLEAQAIPYQGRPVTHSQPFAEAQPPTVIKQSIVTGGRHPVLTPPTMHPGYPAYIFVPNQPTVAMSPRELVLHPQSPQPRRPLGLNKQVCCMMYVLSTTLLERISY